MSDQHHDRPPLDGGQGLTEEVKQAAKDLNGADPQVILEWGSKRFGRALALACSFGYEDVALVHMMHQVDADAKIFYLDTDLLFEETYRTRDRLAEKYGIRFIRVRPAYTLDEQAKLWGDQLWKRDPNSCCMVRKVEPLRRFLKGYDAWCTGIRREQSPTRAHTQVVEWDTQFQMVKLNPLAHWKEAQIWDYIHQHQIPYNPMHDNRYPSIGCIPCTRQVQPGEDSRAGRWSGTNKTECGLHPSSTGEQGGDLT
ncbi:phosphoadenosine phosphosulfate reductase [Melghirimyces thermohalophilus]|uniref:Adenosine 5'-phosphosulfate reductase n=1 Tax=Melghirimyces thermohalophilus TaxID=1236220 RepID=A0A1G6KN99_9BACL|nr:phosphoadenylyl-sulfate reductase [Melghirimyces thermohalophilus]SDC32453.1 phosphoadenosine phosphosulfate reductase [Melghirimyces thermohalophilus]